MTNVVRRFIKEAICREKLCRYVAIYRLSDGKYYKVVTTAYDDKEARRIVKKDLSDATYHEYEPNEYHKKLVKIHKGIYVYFIGEA